VGIGSFVHSTFALIIAIIMGIWKIYRPNIIVHNITELFIYGGLAAIFVSMINLFSGIILLFLISLYDMYAVWKSKHMITLAQAQSSNKLFAGFMIPYNTKNNIVLKSNNEKIKKSVTKEKKVVKERSAILGGGDIGFPLIFTTVAYKTLIITGTSRPLSLSYSLIITFFTTIALSWLFIKGEKEKFYPAMPFLSLGCLIGFIVIGLLKPELFA